MKMSKYGTEANAWDQSEFKTAQSKDGPPEKRSELVKRAHHYAYMTKVEKVREPESYAKTVEDANWCAAMEEEIRTL